MATAEEIVGWAGEVSELVKAHRRETASRAKLEETLGKIGRAAERGEVFVVAELLDEALLKQVEATPALSGAAPALTSLRAHALDQIDGYKVHFREDLLRLAQEANVEMYVDFPRFTSLKGIEGQVDFTRRITTLNNKALKTLDPSKIVAAVAQLKKTLYGRELNTKNFIEELREAYEAALKRSGGISGEPASITDVYLELVLSRQSKRFLQDMQRGAFTGYGVDELAVDLWRMFEAGVFVTASGHSVQLRAGRTRALWLIDRDGERRQISTLAFVKVAA